MTMILFVSYFYINSSKDEVSTHHDSISEESDEMNKEYTGIDSLEDLGKEEIESFKNKIKSQLTDIDYETYIQQFWVGLLEGDGTITVSSPGANHVKVRMVISLKNLRANAVMLRQLCWTF